MSSTEPIGKKLNGGGKISLWKRFKDDCNDAGKWMVQALLEVHCYFVDIKYKVDHPDEISKTDPSGCLHVYVNDGSREKHVDAWTLFFELSIGFLVLMVGALIMWYIFPAFSIFGEIFEGMYDVSIYAFRSLGSIFEMWTWLFGVVMNFFTDTMMKSIGGGNPALWWLMGAECIGLSVAYVFAGIMGIYHSLLNTPIETVFGTLNTPFRWMRINVLQKFFGKTLGNIISLIELPLESMVFLISLPIALVYWGYEKLIDGKNA